MRSLRDDLVMTVPAFLAFADARPEGERWELIDGEPIMDPSPSYGHQKLVGNLFFLLKDAELRGAPWEVLPGLGVRLSDRSMPVPDVLVRPAGLIDGHFCDDAIAAFEFLSPSSHHRDLRWKRRAYETLPSLQHYVVLLQNKVEMRLFDRASGWAETIGQGAETVMRLEALGVALSATSLYAGMGFL